MCSPHFRLYAWNTELEMFSFMGGQTSSSKEEIQNFGMVTGRYLSLVFITLCNLIINECNHCTMVIGEGVYFHCIIMSNLGQIQTTNP